LDEDQVDEKQGEAKEEAVDEARVPGRRPPSMRPAARAARDKLKKLRFDEGLFNYEAHGSYLSGKARTQLPSRPVESSSSSSESSYGSSPDGKPAPKKAKGAPPARKNAKGAQAARKKVNAVLVTRKKAAVRNQARAPSDRPGASAPAPVPPPTAGAAVQASLARSPAPPSTAEAAALGAASPDASSIGTSCRCLLKVVLIARTLSHVRLRHRQERPTLEPRGTRDRPMDALRRAVFGPRRLRWVRPAGALWQLSGDSSQPLTRF
jgi:hypothetical protein